MVRLQNTLWKDSKKCRPENSKTPGEELPIITTSSAVVLSAFGLEGNIFSMCCNTGDFLKVTTGITAIPLLAYFTGCSAS